MSLKDAIREAVDERDKQGEQEKTALVDTPQDNSVAAIQAPPKRKVDDQQSSKAVNTQSSKAVQITPDQEEVDSDEKVEFAALTIRVTRQSRIHWLVSAKQQNTTLTAAIIEALNARFGEAGS